MEEEGDLLTCEEEERYLLFVCEDRGKGHLHGVCLEKELDLLAVGEEEEQGLLAVGEEG